MCSKLCVCVCVLGGGSGAGGDRQLVAQHHRVTLAALERAQHLWHVRRWGWGGTQAQRDLVSCAAGLACVSRELCVVVVVIWVCVCGGGGQEKNGEHGWQRNVIRSPFRGPAACAAPAAGDQRAIL
jgi:hypothetical protein